MNDEKQDSEKLTSHSKLSATVPAFVPREAYTGPTFSGNLVINSNLSPLVPEFKPSVPFTSYAPPYKPGHHFQYSYHQSYIKQGNIELQQNVPFQVYQTSYSQSRKSTAKKTAGKTTETRKKEQNKKGQNTAENNGGENLTDADSTVNVKKKRRRRKKKELPDSTLQQDQAELNSESLSDIQKESAVVPVKDDSSETKHENASSEERKLCSSLEQNSTTLHSTLNSSAENIRDSKTNVGVTAVESYSNTDEQCHKKQHAVRNFPVSYSDKVKSLASKNSSIASCNLNSEKSWTKDFSPDSSRMKKETHSQISAFQTGESRLTSNISHGKTKEMKGGKRTGDESRYSRLKNDEASKSCTKNVEQIGREGSQMGRNNNVKKLTCDNDDDDDDDNWRLKRDDPKVVDPTVLSRTENITKSNVKNLNTESVNKRTYQSEDVESKKFDKPAKCDKSSSHITVEGGKSLKKQQKLSEFASASPVDVACNTMSSSSVHEGSDVHNVTQRVSDSANSLSVAPSNTKIMEGEFPDLRDSVKIKRRSAVDSRTSDHKEMTSSPKPSATMSYSAVLRSTPQPKPVVASPAWESEHPTKQGGLLKVPPQTMADGAENEAEADGNKQKKKKKKKKKTKEAGDNAQESASTKRTEKPIQFDLGVMLQTISTSSTGKKQSSKKHVVATGVLPSQLSAASTFEVKSSVKNVQLLKKDEKVPHNVLDSTAPVVKRGKERETPAKKKPSALKKIILKEREEKKKAREGETVEADKDDEICQDEQNKICEPGEENTVHQEVQSPSEDDTANSEPSSPTDQEIAAEMHSRKFREYCFQVPDKEVDTVAMELLRELVRFQDRQFHKDPVKAKAKRRFVLGLREVSKHLKLRKLKCVIISSNVERIKSAGGLDDTLSSIITSCQENRIPVVFALKRQLLGKVLLKKVPVSIVGIFNYDGAQDHFKTLIELTQKTRQAYTEKWTEIRERLELQQKENKSIASTTETDKELSAGGDMSNLPQPITEEDAVTENQHAEAIKSSDDDDDDDNDDDDDDDDGIDDDKENSDDRHNETDAVIIENDLEIQEF